MATGAEIAALADRLGIHREIVQGFSNQHEGRLPASLAELEQWGNAPDWAYGIRRRDPSGAWTPLGKGTVSRPDIPVGAPNAQFRTIENLEDFMNFFPFPDPSGVGASLLNPSSPQAARTAQAFARSAQASANPYQPGTTEYDVWNSANPPPGQPGTVTPEAPGRTYAAQGVPRTGNPAIDDFLQRWGDAAAYGNTQTLQAQIDKAIRDYAIARTDQERQAAYLDLQRWQAELAKVQNQQQRYDDMAKALLSASVTLSSSPRDYYRFNQYTSGGRDIVAQMQQAGPAFSGPTGPIEPGSINDLLQRLAIGPSPATPATPGIVKPGAGLPSLPGLPEVPVPGSAGGPPGALQGGTAGGGTASTSGLPSYEEMLRGLDSAAGGQWSGDRANRDAVKSAWWNANPSRRGQPVPSW